MLRGRAGSIPSTQILQQFIHLIAQAGITAQIIVHPTGEFLLLRIKQYGLDTFVQQGGVLVLQSAFRLYEQFIAYHQPLDVFASQQQLRHAACGNGYHQFRPLYLLVG